jgi:uncharacterized protein
MVIIDVPNEFLWDKGNTGKNFLKHKVTDQECEESFFDQKKKIFRDVLHSNNENRFILLGKTKGGRILFIVFMLRQEKVRVISARDLNRKERHLYE